MISTRSYFTPEFSQRYGWCDYINHHFPMVFLWFSHKIQTMNIYIMMSFFFGAVWISPLRRVKSPRSSYTGDQWNLRSVAWTANHVGSFLVVKIRVKDAQILSRNSSEQNNWATHGGKNLNSWASKSKHLGSHSILLGCWASWFSKFGCYINHN